MVSLKNKKGFTIVELLIVIVIIGILATLVIVTFTGIQQKGRNTQRQTDVKALESHVQSFYAEYGFYPTVADLNTPSFVSTYLKGLDVEALKDPKATSNTLGNFEVTAATTLATPPQYGYLASGSASCVNTTATTLTAGEPVDNGCTNFVVGAAQEGSAKPFFKKSSN